MTSDGETAVVRTGDASTGEGDLAFPFPGRRPKSPRPAGFAGRGVQFRPFPRWPLALLRLGGEWHPPGVRAPLPRTRAPGTGDHTWRCGASVVPQRKRDLLSVPGYRRTESQTSVLSCGPREHNSSVPGRVDDPSVSGSLLPRAPCSPLRRHPGRSTLHRVHPEPLTPDPGPRGLFQGVVLECQGPGPLGG
jgi:hypothetical protein